MHEPVIPSAWRRELVERANLDEAYAVVGGSTHFFAEAFLGRIRSLQLRHADAQEHFQQSRLLSAAAPKTLLNLLRKFLLSTYVVHDAITELPIDRATTKLPELWVPEIPEAMAGEQKDLQILVRKRNCTEAMVRLHLCDFEGARDLYASALERLGGEVAIAHGFPYLGLAAALHNLGEEAEALKHLENAGYVVQSGGNNLSRVNLAALLNAFYWFLGRKEEARDWLAFLDALPCPQATQQIFKRRAKRVLERCNAGERLVLL